VEKHKRIFGFLIVFALLLQLVFPLMVFAETPEEQDGAGYNDVVLRSMELSKQEFVAGEEMGLSIDLDAAMQTEETFVVDISGNVALEEGTKPLQNTQGLGVGSVRVDGHAVSVTLYPEAQGRLSVNIGGYAVDMQDGTYTLQAKLGEGTVYASFRQTASLQ
jgi:hypothetical protein